MGKDELAATLCTVSQTELKVKSDGIRGQRLLEETAAHVGKQVRKSMIDISGIAPEACQSTSISMLQKKD